MNIYSKKQQWKVLLLLAAVIIGISSLWYTKSLVAKISEEERKKVKLWANAYAEFGKELNDYSFVLDVIKDNTTIPIILTDSAGTIITHRNLDSAKAETDPTYLPDELREMKAYAEPIELNVELSDGKQYIYFKSSTILTQLKYYPIFQLAVISLFILVSYLAFSSSRKAEQNQVWVGMSKETAHQLGTPLSSLIAWLEILKERKVEPDTLVELEKDVKRLETITERFSKIGSMPSLEKVKLHDVLQGSLQYMRNRTSHKVNLVLQNDPGTDDLMVPLNVPLFEWVIENLCKNAIDAIDGNGDITLSISDQIQVVYVDVTDTGKGIPKSQHKTIFQPGYTTKKRGWGLGLSLVKRIVEIYHGGKIFIKRSEIGKGTTFRIVLKK